MKYYIGTKMIQAEPKKYGEYVKVKYGKEKDFKSNIDENTEGYIVRYSDDYISWSPKAQFEAAYRII